MTFKPTLAALALLSASVSMNAPALAGTKDDVRDLQARMERAEQALTAASDTSVRVGDLERQIQLLTGQIEQLTFQLNQQGQRLDAISAALAGDAIGAAALGASADGFGGGFDAVPAPMSSGPVDLTNGGAPEAAAPTGDNFNLPTGPSVPSIELPLDPNAAFDYASGFLLAGDYQSAKAAFSLYTDAFPNHVRTADAKFRLGEIHLALGENADAADVFLDHIQSYPNDSRASEAYLKLGTAFARLEKPAEACTVFKTMKSKFPDAAAPVNQRADVEMARIDCQ